MKKQSFLPWLLAAVFFFSFQSLSARKDKKKEEPVKDTLSAVFSGLKWRSIGPAFASGRIADFAVNPENKAIWYVATASGHIWKTVNNGTTFKPVFDHYGAYAIGCLAMDPHNPNVVWAGTGENHFQRVLGYGNGIYKTMDGGKSWKNMGLKNSRQIGMIAINPQNTDIVYVAAEGSVWGPGGDRGLYKTNDGGITWKKVLDISENTGVSNVVLDPRNPDVVYAVSEQRRRHVYTAIAGGPETAFYKSTDGGATWRKLTKGLPSVDMGGIGLAVSPANPDVLYAKIEAAEKAGGFFRSADRGESWTKMSDHYSSGQYFNEITCDPKDVNTVYSLETVTQVTHDGGRTWKALGNNHRHVDDHAMWIDPAQTSHFLIGGDGGVYESFDRGKNFIFKTNLPVTQFYRVAVDNSKPFYYVYGGTQDNNSFGGPSRNTCRQGVTSDEWFITVGGDGFWCAVDPVNPDIVYSEWQYGNSIRYDRKSGESLDIKPQPKKDELTFRWNWNSPLIISPHSHTRLYVAANKIFRSDDRGNSWQEISGDLTRHLDRNSFKVMGKYWSVDAVGKDVSTSLWGTIISLAESDVKEGLIYAGTDDGLIQMTDDGGKHWTKTESFPGVPDYTYVSDICPSHFDENVVFASFDNRKRDDFKPYLLKSSDKGKTWSSITGNLPGNETVYTVEQDFVNPELLFAGTEFGFYFSVDGGKKWLKFTAGLPDVAVRDIAIQRRENDLAIATFGRGFFILDDYTPLRNFKPQLLNDKAYIFPVKDALLYIQTNAKDAQGSTYFVAKNPPFGAVFTYYLKESLKSDKEKRHEKEKKEFEKGEKIKVLTWDEVRQESKEETPHLIFTITDEQGNMVRKINSPGSKGIHRIAWDIRYSSPFPLHLKNNRYDPLAKDNDGMLAMPGKYFVSLSLSDHGNISILTDPVPFNVVALNNTTLPAKDRKAVFDFQRKTALLAGKIQGTMNYTEELIKEMESILQTLDHAAGATPGMLQQARKIRKELDQVQFAFNGFTPKASWEEIPPHKMPVAIRMNNLIYTQWASTSDVTQTMKDDYQILTEEFPPLRNKVKTIYEKEIKPLEKQLGQINAPWTPGRLPEINNL